MIQGKYVETTMVTGPDSDDPTTEAFRYVLMESGSVYGVAYSSNNDGWTAAYDSTVEKLNGYSFNLGDSLTANGAENWLNTLYTWAKELPAKNKTNVALTESVDEGVYSFAFDYATSLYYKVSVSFTLDEKGMCDSLDWTAKIWYNGQTKDTLGNWLTTEVTDDEGNVTNVPAGEDWNGVYVADFAWDVENECWYLVAKEDSWDDEHVWTLTQSAEGEVVDQASQFRITSLAIKDLEGNAVPAELTMVPGGDALYLVMADVVPAEAVFTANNIEAVVDSESYGLSVAVGYYDDTTWDLVADGIKITAYGVGEYPVSITVNGEVVASFTVKVEAPLPESLDAAVYVDEYDTQTIDGTHSMFVGKAVTIIAKADNRFANANAEFTVVDASGEEVDCYTLTTVSTAGGEISAIVFAPTAVGTYTVTLVSTVVDGLTATATIEVKAPADLNTILTGTYLIDNYGTPCGTITFDDGVATIDAAISSGWGEAQQYNAVYSYVVSGEAGAQELTTTLTSGTGALNFDVNDDFALLVTFDPNFGTQYEGNYLSELETSVYTPASYADILKGAYNVEYYGSSMGTITFADGVATISLEMEVQDPDTYEWVWTTLTAKYNYTITTNEGVETLSMTFVEGAESIGFVVEFSTLYVTYLDDWGGMTKYTTVAVVAE